MRLQTSCISCRGRKKRCVPRGAGLACELCALKNLTCNLYAPSIGSTSAQEDMRHSQLEHSELQDHVVSALHDEALVAELTDLYFDRIHEKQHILFHQASFEAQYHAGIIPDYIILGVMALAARFSSNIRFQGVPRCDRGRPFFKRGLMSFYARTELVSVQSLQAAMLLGFCGSTEGDSDQDGLLGAQAIRMAQMLKLPNAATTNPLEKEIEILLFWQAWMMDSWYSSKAQIPRQLQAKPSTQKPLDNLSIVPTSTSAVLDAMRATSLWAILLPLTDLHAEIVNINYENGNRETNAVYNVVVQHLETRLDDWLQGLPSHVHNTPENLQAYKRQGRLRQFAVVHILYHHECQLLYFRFLNGQNTSVHAGHNADVSMCISRCRRHATALSDLMWMGYTIPHEEFLWSPVNGHLLGVASTIHLHTLLFESDDKLVLEAKRLMEQNFVLLLRLSEYWPTLENTMSRLRAVHAACSASNPSKTFGIQSWTSDFLNKFDVPVSEEYITSLVETRSTLATPEPLSYSRVRDVLSRNSSPSTTWSQLMHLWQGDYPVSESDPSHSFTTSDMQDLA